MSTLVVTSKGQIVLPKEMLEHLGVLPGEKITLTKRPGGRIEIRSAAEPTSKIPNVFAL